jgi:biotin operon repressor
MADAEPDSFQPPQIARQVVEIVGPTIDMTRLKALLESAFGARSVKLRATVPLELEQPPRRPKLGKLGTRIMATLADGKPWRAKHLIAEVAEGRVPATVRHEIDLLVEEERIQRPRSGIYMLAGLPPPKAEDIRPFRERSGTGSNASRNTTGKRILAMLDQPTSANRIVKELGITRQRVDQVMKALLSERQVKRIPEPGLKGRWLWILPDADVRKSIRAHVPSLADGHEAVVASLQPDAFHSVSAIAKTVGQSKLAVAAGVRSLEGRGLVVSLKLGQQKYVSATPRGLLHPARTPDAPKAAIANLAEAFGEKRIAFIETLGVLGQARTSEVTAALVGADGRGTELMSGIMLNRLLLSDFAEPIEDGTSGQRRYRLTEVGRLAAALIARDRKPPSREILDQRIEAFKEQRTARLRAVGMRQIENSPTGAGSPAQKALLEALATGTKSTKELEVVISDIVSNVKSVHLMLKTLAGRGLVERVGNIKTQGGLATLWGLKPASG